MTKRKKEKEIEKRRSKKDRMNETKDSGIKQERSGKEK
jgi:hypothetical protein